MGALTIYSCAFSVAIASATRKSLSSNLMSRHLQFSVTAVSLQAAIKDWILHAVVRRSVTLTAGDQFRREGEIIVTLL